MAPAADASPVARATLDLATPVVEAKAYVCPEGGDRRVDIASITELETALTTATPGDVIHLAGADSWVDVKGNGYLMRNNVGTHTTQDDFQTHVIDDMGSGRDNVFTDNTAEVNGPGYGFYIHEPEDSNNTVACDNLDTGAASGVSNQPCTE